MNRSSICLLRVSACAFVLACGSHAAIAQTVARQNQDAADDFAHQLVSQMTLEEKAGQMEQGAVQMAPAAKTEQLIRDGKLGSLLFVTDPKRINELQHIAG